MRKYYVLAAIGLVSAGVVQSEIALTRLFSVTIWYHFSFVAVSIAMLGMAASAVFVHFMQEKRGLASLERLLPLFAFLAGILLIAGLVCYLAIDYRGTFMEDSSSPLRLVPTLLFLPGFYMAGAVICALIARYASDINRLYFADLLAAGLGGAGAVFLLDRLAGPAVLALAGLLFCLAAVFLTFALEREPKSAPAMRSRFLWPVAGLALLVPLLFGASHVGLLSVRYTKEYDEAGLELVHEKWSALARITVIGKRWFKTDRPYGWGLSRKYEGPPVEEMWLEQDASAGSSIVATDGDPGSLEFLDWDVTAVAYALKAYRKVAVIGLGGGRDALLAIRNDAEVWGIEINPDIAELITDRFADYVGRIFNSDLVHVVVADGRTFMEQTGETFDLIQISLIDSWAASASGAYILAENNLYTAEAFEAYMDRMNQNGVLTVSRWALTQTPGEIIRLVVLAMNTLIELGVEDPARHIAVVRGELVGTVLVKKSPFTGEELAGLRTRCDKMAFEPLYMPDTEGGLLSVALVVRNWRNLSGFVAALPYDFSPPTDDRPFFFLMLRPLDALLTPFTWDTGLRQNFTAVQTLYVMFLVLLVVVAVLILLPAWRLRRRGGMSGSPLGASLMFLMLGLGFMLVEIPLIQKLVLVLGHPIYSLTVVLSTLLLFSGIGAALSKRLVFGASHPARRLAVGLVVLAAVVMLLFLCTGTLSHYLLRLPTATRFAAVISLLSVTGFLMGMPFPSAITLLKQRGDEGAIPWLWAVNGASSVLGSVLAFALALLAGFTVAAGAGAICYLLAAWLFAEQFRQ